MRAAGEDAHGQQTRRASRRSSSEDGDHAATELFARRTIELLGLTTIHAGTAPPLTPAALSARPVPMDLVHAIVGAVSASTGFGEDLLGADGAGVPSSASARLQFFQQWCVRILECGALARSSTANPVATARAIMVEHQKLRAPLALNGFLQELAQAAAQHRRPAPISRRAESEAAAAGSAEALLPAAAATAVEIETNRTFRPPADAASIASGLRREHLALVSELLPVLPDACGGTAAPVPAGAQRGLGALRAGAAYREPEPGPHKATPEVNWSMDLEAADDHWQTARQVKLGVQVRRAMRSPNLKSTLSRTRSTTREQVDDAAIVQAGGDARGRSHVGRNWRKVRH